MNYKTPSRLLMAVVCCACWLTASAEVSRTLPGSGGSTIIMGTITEGPDPVGIWFDNGRVSPSLVLNASGHDRGDGPPDVAYREDGRPVAVWAYNAGTDFDIAFSEWNGTSWTATEFLTANTTDDRDPKLFVAADGAIHVVWWVVGVDEVYLSTRPTGSSIWGAALNVTADSPEFDHGRRPSVIEHDGTVYVAYERDTPEGSPGLAQQIMVAAHNGGSSFTTGFAGSSARTGALSPVLHTEGGKAWLDWAHNDNEFGLAEKIGANWLGQGREAWPDTSWVGIEDTRRVIRNRILAE